MLFIQREPERKKKPAGKTPKGRKGRVVSPVLREFSSTFAVGNMAGYLKSFVEGLGPKYERCEKMHALGKLPNDKKARSASFDTWEELNRKRNAKIAYLIGVESWVWGKKLSRPKAEEFEKILSTYLTNLFNTSIKARRIVAEKHGVSGYQLGEYVIDAIEMQRNPKKRPEELQPFFKKGAALERKLRNFVREKFGWNEVDFEEFGNSLYRMQLAANKGMSLYVERLTSGQY